MQVGLWGEPEPVPAWTPLAPPGMAVHAPPRHVYPWPSVAQGMAISISRYISVHEASQGMTISNISGLLMLLAVCKHPVWPQQEFLLASAHEDPTSSSLLQ